MTSVAFPKKDLNSESCSHTRRPRHYQFWYPFKGSLLYDLTRWEVSYHDEVCIAGAAGFGKGLFLNELLSTVLGIRARVIVVDLYGNFKKICQVVGGEYVELRARSLKNLDGLGKTSRGFLRKDLTVIDVMALRGRPDLLKAALYKLIGQVGKDLNSRRLDGPFLILIDGPLDLLGAEEKSQFLKEEQSLTKNYNGSISYGSIAYTETKSMAFYYPDRSSQLTWSVTGRGGMFLEGLKQMANRKGEPE